MSGIIFTILGVLAGAGLLGSGIYYLFKEKDDKDSRKIYGAFIGIGAVLFVGVIIKIVVAGL